MNNYDEAVAKLNKNPAKYYFETSKYLEINDLDGAIQYTMQQADCDETIATKIFLKCFESKLNPKPDQFPRCPTCNSAYIDPISGLERGISVATLGLFSKKINKSFKCKNCGYTW